MNRAVLASVVIWALVASAALAAIPPAGTQDDVQTRTFKDGWGVVVRAPKFGQEPVYSVFQIDPSPTHDIQRIGPYVVDIEWGAGPGGEPVVTIELIDKRRDNEQQR